MLVLHIEKVWKSFRSEHLDKVGELRKLPDMRVSWAVLHHMALIFKISMVASMACPCLWGKGMQPCPKTCRTHPEPEQDIY